MILILPSAMCFTTTNIIGKVPVMINIATSKHRRDWNFLNF